MPIISYKPSQIDSKDVIQPGNELKKVYLSSNELTPSADTNHYLEQFVFEYITEDNYKTKPILNYPLLNRDGKLTEKLLNLGYINQNQVYNLPFDCKFISDKRKYYQFLEHKSFITKTVYTKEEAFDLTFPIICKPAFGHSGIGIAKIDTPEELKNSDKEFDLYQEWFDIKDEYRIIFFKDVAIKFLKKEPFNEKALEVFEQKDEIKFVWKHLPLDGEVFERLKEVCLEINKKLNLDVIAHDICIDASDKIWSIEANSQPALMWDIPTKLYELIYKDFNKIKLDKKSKKLLDEHSEFLINKTQENPRFQ